MVWANVGNDAAAGEAVPCGREALGGGEKVGEARAPADHAGVRLHLKLRISGRWDKVETYRAGSEGPFLAGFGCLAAVAIKKLDEQKKKKNRKDKS